MSYIGWHILVQKIEEGVNFEPWISVLFGSIYWLDSFVNVLLAKSTLAPVD
jgi:hypothetical protein